MHKYLLSLGVFISLSLAVTGAANVEAQTTSIFAKKPVDTRTSVARYLTSIGQYASSTVDPVTGKGTLTVSRIDENRGLILSDFALDPQTVIERKYGGKTTLSDLHVNEELSVYGKRNPDGSMTAVKVTDNNLWLLDGVIQDGEIMAIDKTLTSITVKEANAEQTQTVPISKDTQIIGLHAAAGTKEDLVVGKHIRLRAIVRKTGTTTNIEKALLISILPSHGEHP